MLRKVLIHRDHGGRLRTILLTKITAPQNEDALSYLRVRGLYFLAVVFVAVIFALKS